MLMGLTKYVLELELEHASGEKQIITVWASGPADADEVTFRLLRRTLILNLDERGLLFGSRLSNPRTWKELHSPHIEIPERMH